MSYLALARKWRPHNFKEMVGQEHVLQAMVNAFNQGRIHHAYLFSGTRGVGKTTIARIIAKCLNCLEGVSGEPCGNCKICHEVDQGCHIDLIEVDAASKTKVEDTRNLLDNVQYAPTLGRYKIYLIDEVHMLSGHSFNALLKTLEEPPEHVKFLLATTDPQRLPITVLSRCLQFNLKNLHPTQITQQLKFILTEEKLTFEAAALDDLAIAANGSMRDALSLLDQAIAFGGGLITLSNVRTMLGNVEQSSLVELVEAVANNDATRLFNIIHTLAESGADFATVLEDILSLLHRLALAQALQTAVSDTLLQNLLTQLDKETIQLYYQIALIGRRDLVLAPTAQSGFEMVMLRMLAFSRVEPIQALATAMTTVEPVKQSSPADISPDPTKLTQYWLELVAKLPLTGMTLALARNCTLVSMQENILELLLDVNQKPLQTKMQERLLLEAINQYTGKSFTLTIQLSNTAIATPATLEQQQQSEQHKHALQLLSEDDNVQKLIKTFNATIQAESVVLTTNPPPADDEE